MISNALRRVAPTALRATAFPRMPVCPGKNVAPLSRAVVPHVPAAAISTSASKLKSANTSPPSTDVVDDMSNHDGYFEKDRIPQGDPTKREFTYFVLGGARLIYASTARLIAMKFLASWSPAADVLALATAEFDLSDIPEGSAIIVKWRGKPIFIRKRTEEEIAVEDAVNMEDLRDPESDYDRYIKPQYVLVLGICTHLGCVPVSNAGEYNGWFCPCHGSHYDVSGRIRKGPAPLNLEVPPYKFIEDDKIVIG